MNDKISLDYSSKEVQHLISKDKRLAKLIQMIEPLEYSNYDDYFSFLVSQIIGQMLSNKVAWIIFERLQAKCNGKVTIENISLLSDDEIKSIGTSTRKVNTIRDLCDLVKAGIIDLENIQEKTDEEIILLLTKINGIGSWSAKMFLIFSLNRLDILPYEDGAFLQSYKWLYKTDDIKPISIKKRCQKWKPYSSIAARYLYRALDEGLTKEEFHLFK